jgi:NTE family protein
MRPGVVARSQSMRAHAKILKRHPAFTRFANRTINRLTAHSQVVEYPKGTVLYESGDPVSAMYMVMSGRCQAHVAMPDGSEQILDLYAPGDIFGERALVTGERHWATVKVVTDCVLLRIAAEDVNYLFNRSPKLARELVLRLVDQFNMFRQETHAPDLGRAVTLVRVGDADQTTVIAENMALALLRESGGSVLYVHLGTGGDDPVLAEWEAHAPVTANGGMAQGGEDVRRFRLRVRDVTEDAEKVAPMISELSRRFRYVMVVAEADVPSRVVLEFIEQSDLAYAFFRQTPDGLYRANLLLRHVQDELGGETDVLPVLCLQYEERSEPFEDLRTSLGRDVHGVVHCLPPERHRDLHRHYAHSREGRFSSHIRLLAREIGRRRVGLALSSGGAKGFAYVGIIQVLEENGVHVDVIAGTSMGAYIGALWAYGLTGQELKPLAMDMAKPHAFFKLIDPVIPPRRGFMRGRKIRRLLQKSIGDAHFSDMQRQLRVVATDLDTLERIVYDSGEVSLCVQASMAMPGVFVPVQHGERTVIDGGIADPLPVDVLMQMGVERIIAVNAVPNPEVMRSRVEMSREVAALPRAHARAMKTVGHYVNYFAPGNILDILMKGIHGAQTRTAEGACKQADVVLRPVAQAGKWHDFSNAEAYINVGRQVAEEQLDEIKALVTPEPAGATSP